MIAGDDVGHSHLWHKFSAVMRLGELPPTFRLQRPSPARLDPAGYPVALRHPVRRPGWRQAPAVVWLYLLGLSIAAGVRWLHPSRPCGPVYPAVNPSQLLDRGVGSARRLATAAPLVPCRAKSITQVQRSQDDHPGTPVHECQKGGGDDPGGLRQDPERRSPGSAGNPNSANDPLHFRKRRFPENQRSADGSAWVSCRNRASWVGREAK